MQMQVIRPLNSLSTNTDGDRSDTNMKEKQKLEFSTKNILKNAKQAKRIAVIGAGFSGLTAAAELKRLGEILELI